jgi:hypothetical protein
MLIRRNKQILGTERSYNNPNYIAVGNVINLLERYINISGKITIDRFGLGYSQ